MMMRTLTAAVMAGVWLTGCVQAVDGPTTSFEGLAGSRHVETDGNVSMDGLSVTLHGRVGGWVEMNGASVDVDAEIGGDLEANGASVEIAGRVTGATQANGAAVRLEGAFIGPVEVNGANIRLDGQYAGDVTLHAASVALDGDFAAPVTILGQGRDRTMLGRPRVDQSTVRIDGHLASGGWVCAHEVRLEPGATLGGVLTVFADAPPVRGGVQAAEFISYQPRDGADCETLRRGAI